MIVYFQSTDFNLDNSPCSIWELHQRLSGEHCGCPRWIALIALIARAEGAIEAYRQAIAEFRATYKARQVVAKVEFARVALEAEARFDRFVFPSQANFTGTSGNIACFDDCLFHEDVDFIEAVFR